MRGVAKILTMLLAVALLAPQSVSAWNGQGHRVVGHIADCNLTPKARKMCQKYLGDGLSTHASWMDKVRYTEAYHHTARWHSVGVKDGKFVPSNLTGSKARYDTPMQEDDYGSAKLAQLQKQLRSYRDLSDSTVVVGLKLIIHIVGDLHCPGHIFYADQSQQYHIRIGGKRTHFHSCIDRSYSRFHDGVSPNEFYQSCCRLSKREIKELCKGDMESWIRDNESLYRECYKILPPGVEYDDLSSESHLRLKEITDRLLRDAGYRLAHIINDIFR